MNVGTRAEGGTEYDQVVDCLADDVRRETLSVLRDRSGRVAVEELATYVTAGLTDDDLVDVTREERRPVLVGLRHVHLPKLVEADLVEWDPERGTAASGDDSLLGHPVVEGMLDADADDLDAVIGALRSEQRRIALGILEETDVLDRSDLARHVVARETDTAPWAVPDDEVQRTEISLHHVHVPTLQQAGLVVYDERTVRYVGHPDIDPRLFSAALPEAETVGKSAEDGTDEAHGTDAWDDESSIRTIDGREDIVAHGQQLFDEADDELFLMVTTDGLLEPMCVEKLRDAIDRGVDVYVGSQTPAVRDHVREELPEVTIWEPQMDWLNLPPNREKLGRLVLADRSAVMIGTLGEPDGDGGFRETAITGEGDDNSLVILLRELLGSRLDHLDAQSADFRSQIPL